MEDLVNKMNAHYEQLVEDDKITHIGESFGYKLACDFVEQELKKLPIHDVIGQSELLVCIRNTACNNHRCINCGAKVGHPCELKQTNSL